MHSKITLNSLRPSKLLPQIIQKRNAQALRFLSQSNRNNLLIPIVFNRHYHQRRHRRHHRNHGHNNDDPPEVAGRLGNKVIIVTGAGGRLGHSICDLCISEGANVIAVDKNEKKVESLRNVKLFVHLNTNTNENKVE